MHSSFKHGYLEQYSEQWVCPIGLELMMRPITIDCGHTFQYENLVEWRKNSRKCPLCRETMAYNNIFKQKNWSIKRACQLCFDQQCLRAGVRWARRFNIFVRSQKLVTIQTSDEDSIGSIMIKVALKRKCKIPIDLHYGGKKLKANERVKDYNIQPLVTLLQKY